MTQELTDTTIKTGCEKARDRYRALNQADARTAFAFELQGFLVSEMDRGLAVREVCNNVAHLMVLFGKANQTDILAPDEKEKEKEIR